MQEILDERRWSPASIGPSAPAADRLLLRLIGDDEGAAVALRLVWLTLWRKPSISDPYPSVLDVWRHETHLSVLAANWQHAVISFRNPSHTGCAPTRSHQPLSAHVWLRLIRARSVSTRSNFPLSRLSLFPAVRCYRRREALAPASGGPAVSQPFGLAVRS